MVSASNGATVAALLAGNDGYHGATSAADLATAAALAFWNRGASQLRRLPDGLGGRLTCAAARKARVIESVVGAGISILDIRVEEGTADAQGLARMQL